MDETGLQSSLLLLHPPLFFSSPGTGRNSSKSGAERGGCLHMNLLSEVATSKLHEWASQSKNGIHIPPLFLFCTQ